MPGMREVKNMRCSDTCSPGFIHRQPKAAGKPYYKSISLYGTARLSEIQSIIALPLKEKKPFHTDLDFYYRCRAE